MPNQQQDAHENKALTLSAAEAELHDAIAEYAGIKGEEGALASRMCASTNRVNQAQERIDAILEKLRERAPRESEWARARMMARATQSPAGA